MTSRMMEYNDVHPQNNDLSSTEMHKDEKRVKNDSTKKHFHFQNMK